MQQLCIRGGCLFVALLYLISEFQGKAQSIDQVINVIKTDPNPAHKSEGASLLYQQEIFQGRNAFLSRIPSVLECIIAVYSKIPTNHDQDPLMKLAGDLGIIQRTPPQDAVPGLIAALSDPDQRVSDYAVAPLYWFSQSPQGSSLNKVDLLPSFERSVVTHDVNVERMLGPLFNDFLNSMQPDKKAQAIKDLTSLSLSHPSDPYILSTTASVFSKMPFPQNADAMLPIAGLHDCDCFNILMYQGWAGMLSQTDQATRDRLCSQWAPIVIACLNKPYCPYDSAMPNYSTDSAMRTVEFACTLGKYAIPAKARIQYLIANSRGLGSRAQMTNALNSLP